MFGVSIIAPTPSNNQRFENFSKAGGSIILKPVNSGFDTKIHREMGIF